MKLLLSLALSAKPRQRHSARLRKHARACATLNT